MGKTIITFAVAAFFACGLGTANYFYPALLQPVLPAAKEVKLRGDYDKGIEHKIFNCQPQDYIVFFSEGYTSSVFSSLSIFSSWPCLSDVVDDFKYLGAAQVRASRQTLNYLLKEDKIKFYDPLKIKDLPLYKALDMKRKKSKR